MENIKTIERIIDMYRKRNITEEGFHKMITMIGDITGESAVADYINVRGCATRMQTLLEEGAIISIYGECGSDPNNRHMRVHMTLEGCFDMMLHKTGDLNMQYRWKVDDYCEMSFYDDDRNIEYFVLLDEDDLELFEVVFGIDDILPTHDRNGNPIRECD